MSDEQKKRWPLAAIFTGICILVLSLALLVPVRAMNPELGPALHTRVILSFVLGVIGFLIKLVIDGLRDTNDRPTAGRTPHERKPRT